MTMCTSGAIGIISAPQGGCSSICTAVGCASGSLSVLSIAAGKTAPHAMSEFYGYSNISALYLSNIYCCSCDCFELSTNVSQSLDCIAGMTPNTCVGTTYCWCLTKQTGLASSSICIFCNGTCIRGACISGQLSRFCNGTFTVFTQLSTDNVCVCTFAATNTNKLLTATAEIRLCGLTQCVGSYCIGFPNSAISVAPSL